MTEQSQDIATAIMLAITFTVFVILIIVDTIENKRQAKELKRLLTIVKNDKIKTKPVNQNIKVRVISSKIISNVKS